MMLLLGSAVDLKRVATASSRAQEAADAAAIAIAKQPGVTQVQRQGLATNIVTANLGALAALINAQVTETEPGVNNYSVQVSGSMPTVIMKIAGFSSVNLSRSSSATTGLAYVYGTGASGAAGTGANAVGHGCVLSMDNSQVDSFWDTGNAQVSIGCDIIVNSSSASALDVNGSAQLNLITPSSGSQPLVFIRGGYSSSTPSRVTPQTGPCSGSPLCTNVTRNVADPYASLAVPTAPSEGVVNYNYATGVNATLKPGIYHNGIAINANAVVTFSPGTYIIDGGSLTVNGQATVIGDKVNIVFTKTQASSYAQATINGGAVVALRAPSQTDCTAADSGAYSPCIPGIVFFGDPNMPVGTSFKVNGGSTQTFVGALYLPSAALDFTGGSTASVLPAGTLSSNQYDGCMQIIADTIKFTGSSSFGNVPYSGCTNGSFMRAFGVAAAQTAMITH